MKKHAATLLILMLAALTGLVNAQTRILIKADVPFDFVANGVKMPAGECAVETQGQGTATLLIMSGKAQVFAIPHASWSLSTNKNSVMVFHRYGDRYFLSGIRREGRNEGYELPASRAERELRAQNVEEKDEILLAYAK